MPGLTGNKHQQNGGKKINKSKLTTDDAASFLDNIEFARIESINTIIPEFHKQAREIR